MDCVGPNNKVSPRGFEPPRSCFGESQNIFAEARSCRKRYTELGNLQSPEGHPFLNVVGVCESSADDAHVLKLTTYLVLIATGIQAKK